MTTCVEALGDTPITSDSRDVVTLAWPRSGPDDPNPDWTHSASAVVRALSQPRRAPRPCCVFLWSSPASCLFVYAPVSACRMQQNCDRTLLGLLDCDCTVHIQGAHRHQHEDRVFTAHTHDISSRGCSAIPRHCVVPYVPRPLLGTEHTVALHRVLDGLCRLSFLANPAECLP